MPSKHYLPEMSDSPLHWVTRPLRSYTLCNSELRILDYVCFSFTARRSTGIRPSSSTIRDRPSSSSTPPMHRPTTTSLSRAYPEAARLSESSSGSRRHPEIRRTADRPTHAPVRPDIKRHPDIAQCPDAFRSDVMSPADGQPPNGRRHLRGRGRYQSTPCSTIDLATFMKPAMLAPFM